MMTAGISGPYRTAIVRTGAFYGKRGVSVALPSCIVFKAKGNPPLSNFMTNTEMRNHNLFTVVNGSKIVFNWTVNDYKKWLSNKFASAKKDYEQVLLNPEILAEREAKNEQTYKKYLAQERVKKGKRKTNIVDN